MKLLSRIALWTTAGCLIVLAIACSGPAPSDSRAADEAAIRQTDDSWLKAIAAKQLDATVSFYDERASLFVPNAPIATGREDIHKTWARLFAVPGFALAPRTAKIEVARSGDLAYAQGTYEFTANDAKGAPATDRGKFVVVWKKQADGSWKAVADIFNSDLPPAPGPQ
jgi:ketosteroid isomerase-like protein